MKKAEKQGEKKQKQKHEVKERVSHKEEKKDEEKKVHVEELKVPAIEKKKDEEKKVDEKKEEEKKVDEKKEEEKKVEEHKAEEHKVEEKKAEEHKIEEKKKDEEKPIVKQKEDTKEDPKKKQQQPKKEAAKQQQQKGQQQKGQKGGAKKDEQDQPDITHLDIRIGHILHVEKHPDADTLYVEQIDLGESAPRTIVSGLVNFVPIEQMKDRMVVVLCNLKPKPTRGVTSAGMVLCASDGDHGAVEPLDPPKGVKAGERVFFEGFTGFEPDEVLNPKKKHFEKVQPEFKTTNDHIAVWKDLPFMTSQGPCTVKSIVGGGIR